MSSKGPVQRTFKHVFRVSLVWPLVCYVCNVYTSRLTHSVNLRRLQRSNTNLWSVLGEFYHDCIFFDGLCCVQTDATLLTNNSQHCWMLHVASVCTSYCMLLDVVAYCCERFETGQTFQPTTPNISFVPWSPKRSATMLDPLAQLFQQCWGRARSLRMAYKDLWVVSFPGCTAGPNIVSSCCIRLHTTANTHAALGICWTMLFTARNIFKTSDRC